MNRPRALPLRFALLLAAMSIGANARAASSETNSSASIVAPGGTTANPAAVTGSVVLPLTMTIGASSGAFAGALPVSSFGNGLRLRIGTESANRNIARVMSRSDLQQASFTIIGERDQIISIAVPPTVSLARLNGEGAVEFAPVANVPGAGAGERLVASPDGTGMLAFDIGGGLMPSAFAAAGAYVGVLKVVVQYN